MNLLKKWQKIIVLSLFILGITFTGYGIAISNFYNSDKGTTISDLTAPTASVNKGHWDVENIGNNDYFIPTKTSKEWDAFYNSQNSLSGITVKCSTDYYILGNTCSNVGIGFYSPSLDNTKYSCTNKPGNSAYSGSGNGGNACLWYCTGGYIKSGNSCIPPCQSGWSYSNGWCYQQNGVSNPRVGSGAANPADPLWDYSSTGNQYCNQFVRGGSQMYSKSTYSFKLSWICGGGPMTYWTGSYWFYYSPGSGPDCGSWQPAFSYISCKYQI